MKTLLMSVALAGTFGSGTAMAGANDGNELLMECQHFIKLIDDEKGYSSVYAGACGGFVQGVGSTVYFLSGDLEKDAKFCTPKNASNAQLVRVVVKYLKDNPKQLHKGKTVLAWSALKDAYPCK